MLDVARAQVFDVGVQHRNELVANVRRHHDFARTGQRGKPCREVDATPVDIVLVRDKLADVRAHAKQHLPVRRHAGVGLCASVLDREGGPDRRLHAGKFQHQPVAHALDQPPGMGGQHIPLHGGYDLPPSLHCIALVGLHEPDGFHQIDEQHRPHDPFRVVAGGLSVS